MEDLFLDLIFRNLKWIETKTVVWLNWALHRRPPELLAFAQRKPLYVITAVPGYKNTELPHSPSELRGSPKGISAPELWALTRHPGAAKDRTQHPFPQSSFSYVMWVEQSNASQA